jgi:pheromone shutdown protein TraB
MTTTHDQFGTRQISEAQLRSLKFSGAGLGLAALLVLVTIGTEAIYVWLFAPWALLCLSGISMIFADRVCAMITKRHGCAILGGILYAWFTVLAPTIFTGLIAALLNYDGISALFDWVVLPVFWIGAFGALPAAILGAIFGEVTWRASTSENIDS